MNKQLQQSTKWQIKMNGSFWKNSQSSANNYTLMPDYNSRKVGNYDNSIV